MTHPLHHRFGATPSIDPTAPHKYRGTGIGWVHTTDADGKAHRSRKCLHCGKGKADALHKG